MNHTYVDQDWLAEQKHNKLMRQVLFALIVVYALVLAGIMQ